jgi:hypothetical protein
MEVKLKLIGSNDPDLFERRLNDFLASLDKDDLVVDVKFSTTAVGAGLEYSALIHYQATDAWND